MKMQSHLLIASLSLLLVSSAVAADLPRKAPRAPAAIDRCAKSEPAPGTPEVPGGDIFGFTSPTDIGDPCGWALAEEITGGAGKRDGSYLALTSKTQFAYTWSDRLAFAFSPFVSYNRWSNVTAIQDLLAEDGAVVSGLNRTVFDGLSGEIAYRVLARSPGQPFAVTLSAEPRWARVGLSGWDTEVYASEFKLFVDVALRERLFAAMNVNYVVARSRVGLPDAEWSNGSGLVLSGALTGQVYAAEKQAIEGVFLGVEARLLSEYEGLGLNHNVGNGVFVGPTLAIAFAGGRMLNFVWTPQVWGEARPASAAGSLDLDNFARHQFRVKFATALGG